MRLFVVLLLLFIAPLASANPFLDVRETDPHFDAIMYAFDNGIASGFPDGTFGSVKTVNRVEILKLLMEAEHAGAPPCERAFPYTDVEWHAWYSEYLQLASCLGVVSGDPQGTYRPADPVNVAEGMKILAEAFTLEANTDYPVWYEGYARDLMSRNAVSTDVASPESPLTRGQMVEMIYRLKQGITNLPSHSYDEWIGNTHHSHGEFAHKHEVDTASHCDSFGCNSVTISTDDNYRYITSNGLPNHETGDFPNSGNPNTISTQRAEYRMKLRPTYNETATPVRMPGVALNGVFFEPGTAERSGSYSYEALQEELNLGLDFNNAHVQPTGAYHYHSVPTSLVEEMAQHTDDDLVHIGWAADGFPMYYSLSSAYKSSYKIKTGSRAEDPPGGNYNGTFTQDFEYVAGSGDLDDCNGTWVDDQYLYVLTHDFPYIPRCLHGEPDPSFTKGPGAGGPTSQSPGGPGAGGPPVEAVSACTGKKDGTSCSFSAPHGLMSGTCRNVPEGVVACVP